MVDIQLISKVDITEQNLYLEHLKFVIVEADKIQHTDSCQYFVCGVFVSLYYRWSFDYLHVYESFEDADNVKMLLLTLSDISKNGVTSEAVHKVKELLALSSAVRVFLTSNVILPPEVVQELEV